MLPPAQVSFTERSVGSGAAGGLGADVVGALAGLGAGADTNADTGRAGGLTGRGAATGGARTADADAGLAPELVVDPADADIVAALPAEAIAFEAAGGASRAVVGRALAAGDADVAGPRSAGSARVVAGSGPEAAAEAALAAPIESAAMSMP